jgi:hypothetical protein
MTMLPPTRYTVADAGPPDWLDENGVNEGTRERRR